MPALPEPRGPISEWIVDALRGPAQPSDPPGLSPDDGLAGEDLHLSLYVCYELHYRGFDGVDEGWEWEPSLLALRGRLEGGFERALFEAIGPPGPGRIEPERVDLAVRELAEADEGPSLSRYAAHRATLEQMREFVIHRSAYQLKEADPHTWAIPRLSRGPKAAMVEIQADEYGGGRAERIHAELFAGAMAALGLDPTYGTYLDRIPGVTLATVNLMSLCGLHRRWLGAIVGHLALFELTSAVPNRRYADFFDEHVLADAVHENIAAVDLAGGLVRQRPELAPDVIWGAQALLFLEGRWARHLLERWDANESSLLEPAVVGG
jgi:hypothetical protein